MYPRHRIDIRQRDLLFGVLACCLGGDPRRVASEIEAMVAPPEDAIVCLSVRSGFDLLLGALELPRGSEVLVSAITHPDMVGILELHGLVPVPIDLALDTLSPPPEVIDEAFGPDTRAILLAPLFGTSIDLVEISALARKHGALLIDDRAQALCEPDLRSEMHADVSLFSFGPIKSSTALGGAVVRVRDARLRLRMRRTLEAWPAQPTREFLGRTTKFAALSVLAHPVIYGWFVRACEWRGRDLDALLSAFVRGFKVPYDDPAFTDRIRRSPSCALLRLLRRRLEDFPSDRIARREALGERLASALPGTVAHPGSACLVRTHWVFPVLASNPARLVTEVRRRGLDAAPAEATSAITVVEAPAGRTEPVAARWFLEHVVFLPAYPELPEQAILTLLGALHAAESGAAPVDVPEPLIRASSPSRI